MASLTRLEGIWVKIGHSSTLRIGRIKSDGKVKVQWCNRTSKIAQTTDGTSIKINWDDVAGHREWNQGGENFSNFVLQPNDTLLEKGHHSWRRVQHFHSHQDIEFFKQHGYLILRKAIPPKIVKRARRAIFADIKNHYVGATQDPEGYRKMAAQTFATALREDDGGTLSDLMSCSVMGQAAEALVGRIVPRERPPQVAIRFPQDPRQDATPPGYSGPHIDGVPTSTNGVTSFSPFTCLVGCALSDQEDDFEGNLTVYPGSHQQTCLSFHQNMAVNQCLWAPDNQSMFPQYGGDVAELNEHHAPLQLHLNAGDVVILHYLLIHCVADNRGSDIRINCYWRMRHQELSDADEESVKKHVTQLWNGFDAIEEN